LPFHISFDPLDLTLPFRRDFDRKFRRFFNGGFDTGRMHARPGGNDYRTHSESQRHDDGGFSGSVRGLTVPKGIFIETPKTQSLL
jgi:hypothetical protein